MNPDFIKTGEDLREWRKENRYTIQALAKKINYDKTYLCHVETRCDKNGVKRQGLVPKKLIQVIKDLHSETHHTPWPPYTNLKNVLNNSSRCKESGQNIEKALIKLTYIKAPEKNPHKTESYLELFATVLTKMNKIKEMSDSNTHITTADIYEIYNEMADLTISYFESNDLLGTQQINEQ